MEFYWGPCQLYGWTQPQERSLSWVKVKKKKKKKGIFRVWFKRCTFTVHGLTFPDHGHSYRHAHELALGPYVSVDAHPPLPALTVKPWNWWMMGHLLAHKADSVAAFWRIVRLLRGVGAPAWLPGGPRVRSDQRFNFVPRHFPGTVEGLAQHGVVGLLGHGALSPLVEGGQVVLDKADDAVLGCGPSCDWQEHVRVGHEVGVHLQQWSLFQDEGRQHHLGKTKKFKRMRFILGKWQENNNYTQYRLHSWHINFFLCVPEFLGGSSSLVSTRVRSMPSLSWESRWRMMLRWSSRTPRSSSSLSSVSVTSSLGLMSSSPWCCCEDKKKEDSLMIYSFSKCV